MGVHLADATTVPSLHTQQTADGYNDVLLLLYTMSVPSAQPPYIVLPWTAIPVATHFSGPIAFTTTYTDCEFMARSSS